MTKQLKIIEDLENVIKFGGQEVSTDYAIKNAINYINTRPEVELPSVGDIEVVLLGWFDCEMNNKNIMNIAKAIYTMLKDKLNPEAPKQ